MEKLIEFEAAYGRRDPDPNKDYGIHGVNIRFVLKGAAGAVQFILYTNWQLPNVRQEFEERFGDCWPRSLAQPLPADLGYHSPKPMYDDHEPIDDSCPYLDGKPCYYDGSTLAAERIFDVLTAAGAEGVWRELEEYYKHIFKNDHAD